MVEELIMGNFRVLKSRASSKLSGLYLITASQRAVLVGA